MDNYLVEQGKPAEGIFFDFSKAFDRKHLLTPSHGILLDKMPITEVDKNIING